MHNDKTHSINRFLLLGILFVSAVLPLTNLQFFNEEVPLKQVEVFREFVSAPVFTPDIANPDNSEIPQILQSESSISIHSYLIIYISIILVLLLRILVSIARVLQIIRKAEKRKIRKVVLAIVKDLIQPFTFFNKIILSEKDFNENKDIVVAHEHAHIKQLHAIDLVVCELFTVVHFFNPFMWLLRRDLKLVHEYQADQAVLNKGIDAKKYQLLVLQKSVGERRFAMANHFTQKPILKRIKMMKKKNENRWTGVKLLIFIPLSVMLLMAFSITNVKLPAKENLAEQIVEPISNDQSQNVQKDFVIEIKKDGNYIDNQLCKLDEIVKRARTWQKTGSEDILLLTDNQLSYTRVDEIRNALEDADIYHVNQQIIGSEEIIYPHGDVSKLAKFKQGSWDNWLDKQLAPFFKDKYKEQGYKVKYGFVIDKNGKVSEGRVMKSSNIPELDAEYARILSEIPDWQPSIKNGKPVNVFWTFLGSRKIVTVTTVVEKK
jgi:biopolymer transport protein ExbD